MIIGICGKMCGGKSIVASYLVERGYTLIDVDLFGHQALTIHQQQIVDIFGRTIVGATDTPNKTAVYSQDTTAIHTATHSKEPTATHAPDKTAAHSPDRTTAHTPDQTAVHTLGNTPTHTPDSIDRKKLASLVFRCTKHLRALENIVHPTMIRNIQDAVHNHSGSDIVIDAALLYKLNLHRLCDMVFFIHTTLFKRIQRYRKRTASTIWSIWPAVKIFRSQRDITVNNLSADVDTVVVRNNCSERELRATIAQYIV